MPGVVRGVARTAVVAGTASAVSGRVHHRQQQRWAEQSAQQQPMYVEEPVYVQAPPPPPAAPTEDDTLAKLEKLGQLKASGILTDEEFEAEKAKILAAG